ncbi:MAG TPA: hypothetical protein VL907_09730 [Pyrinomonadaceae bacterium]|jgi:hypothetical protein|nr:hypothetical protein [Pyrinomonadaceae bacterium]
MTKCLHRYPTHFRIFTADVVFRDKRLHLVAQALVDRSLTSYRSSTSSFRAATRFEERTSMTRSNATEFSIALAPRERTAQTALQCS